MSTPEAATLTLELPFADSTSEVVIFSVQGLFVTSTLDGWITTVGVVCLISMLFCVILTLPGECSMVMPLLSMTIFEGSEAAGEETSSVTPPAPGTSLS